MEKTLVVEGNVKEIERSKYSSMEIENLEIKEGVEIIGERAFFDNNIKKVSLPKSVKKVGDLAFMHNGVEELTFYNNGIEFGKKCFALETECYYGFVHENCPGEVCSEYYSPIQKLTIIDGDYKILSLIAWHKNPENYSLRGCSLYNNVQEVNLVNDNINLYEVLKIKELANKYPYIRINIIRNNVLIFTNQNEDGIKLIEDDQDRDMNIESTEIKDGVKTIKDSQYKDMNIESFEIKEGVETIGEYAFFDNNIKKLFLPKSVKKVMSYAFGNNEVEELTFYNNGIEFGNDCFKCYYKNSSNMYDCYLPIKKLTIIDGNYQMFSDILFDILSRMSCYGPSILDGINHYVHMQEINIVNNNISVSEAVKIEELAHKYPYIRINIIRNNVLIFTNQNDLLIEEQNQNDLLDEESIQRGFEKIKKLFKK